MNCKGCKHDKCIKRKDNKGCSSKSTTIGHDCKVRRKK